MENATIIQFTTVEGIHFTSTMSTFNAGPQAVNNSDDTVTTDSSTEFNVDVSTLVICTIGNVFITLLSCYGNGKVLFTCCQTFNVHSNFRWLKTNLSAADFLLSLTQCPIIAFLLFGMPGIAKVLVPIAAFSAGLSLTVSLNSITGIAIHRYLKLKCRHDIQRRFTSIFIAYSWICGLALASCFATLVFLKCSTKSNEFSGIVIEAEVFEIPAYVLIVMFLLTLVVTLFVYTTIGKFLLSAPDITPAKTDNNTTNSTGLSMNLGNSHLYHGITNKHATFACFGIACIHAICWLPFVLAFALDTYIKNYNVMCNVKVIAWMFVLLQSAVNPHIYKIPQKNYLKRWYCQQCLHHANCKLHKKWLRPQTDDMTRILEASENAPRPVSRVFQIQIPENNSV